MKRYLTLCSIVILLVSCLILGYSKESSEEYMLYEDYKINYKLPKNPNDDLLYVKSSQGALKLNEFLNKLPDRIDKKYKPMNQEKSYKESKGSVIEWCSLNNWNVIAKTGEGELTYKSSKDAYPIGIYENIVEGKTISYTVYMSDTTVNEYISNPFSKDSKVLCTSIMLYPEFNNYFYGNSTGISVNTVKYELPQNTKGTLLENDFSIPDKLHKFIDPKYHPDYNLDNYKKIVVDMDIQWLESNGFVTYLDNNNIKKVLSAKDAYPIAIIRYANTLGNGGNFAVYMSDNTKQIWSAHPYKDGSVLLDSSIVMIQHFGEKYGFMSVDGDGGVYDSNQKDDIETKPTINNPDIEQETPKKKNNILYIGIALTIAAILMLYKRSK